MTATMNGDDPDAPFPDRLDDGEHDAEGDDRVDASELRDGVQAVRRQRGCVTVPPLRDAVVDPGQLGVRAHQVGEHSEQRRRRRREQQRERQRRPVAAAGSRRAPQDGAQPLDAVPTVSPTLRAASSAGVAAAARVRG